MMGAREWLNEHPSVAIAGGGGIVVLAIGLIVMQVLASRHHYPDGPPQSYFTVDDGKTFFAASSTNVPPFDHNGQQAVAAYVFECGGQKFVGYMERFTPKYHDYVVANGRTPEANRYGRELKRPGDTKWLQSGDLQKEGELEDIRCPNGGTDIPVAVEP
jgi:hypothetical protein